MEKTPISIIIDDSAPLIHVYREHSPTGKTEDGRYKNNKKSEVEKTWDGF